MTRYFKPGDLIIYGLLILIFVLGSTYVASTKVPGAHIAVITVDGQEVRRIDLDRVEKPYEFRLDINETDYNIIRVEPGRIRVVDASCPDKLDVKQGWISDSTRSIVCLPNRMVIQIKDSLPASGKPIDGLAF